MKWLGVTCSFHRILGGYFYLFLSLFSLRDGQTYLGRDFGNVFDV